MQGTKWEIFEVAVNLFANRGYASVGVRDIASVVGIKSASIYNHFENKDAILDRVFEHFDQNYYNNLIEPEEIVKLLPESTHHEILDHLCPTSPDKEYEMLRKILLIAVSEYNNDARAKELLSKVLETMVCRFTHVLNHMIEQELIEPIDVELFSTIFLSFCVSATVSRYNGLHLMPYDKWQTD